MAGFERQAGPSFSMRPHRDYHAHPQPSQVVLLGAFDGLHLGHQTLIRRAQDLAAGNVVGAAQLIQQAASGQTRVATTVVCFEPLPRQFFSPATALARLSSPAERLRCLRDLGVQQCWQLRFNQALAQTSAEDFIRHVLIDRLAVEHVVVGEDFRFGARRQGDLSLLQDWGRRAGFQVHGIGPVNDTEERISSSRIRQALAGGDLALAQRMLGRPFRLGGRVRAGRQLGRTLGYPTANLALPGRAAPLQGIFATRVRLADAAPGEAGWRDSVASLGYRPTVGAGEFLLEVHVFDFQGDLYGRRLEVEFVHKLRDEAHFSTVAAMVEQIHADAAQARRLLQQG